MPASATVRGSLIAEVTSTTDVPGGGSYAIPPGINPAPKVFASGTNADQVDIDHFKRYLPGTAGVSVDLSGTLTDPLAQSAVFARTHALEIAIQGTNSVAISGNFAATNLGGTNAITLPAGGWIQLCLPASGWTVTNGASDIITLTGIGGVGIVDVGVVGRSV
jgi:hypothetical protein